MRRRDLSLPSPPMLTHFTTASPAGSATDSAGTAPGSAGMIRPKVPVVCPFDLFVPIDAKFEEPKRHLARLSRERGQPFGLAPDKRYALRVGCAAGDLPSMEAAARLRPEHEHGRVATMEMNQAPPIDWSFERIKGDLPLASGRPLALLQSWNDADGVDHFSTAGVITLGEIFAR